MKSLPSLFSGCPARMSASYVRIYMFYVSYIFSIRCKLGDIRLWVGDLSTSSCLVSLTRGTQGSGPHSSPSGPESNGMGGALHEGRTREPSSESSAVRPWTVKIRQGKRGATLRLSTLQPTPYALHPPQRNSAGRSRLQKKSPTYTEGRVPSYIREAHNLPRVRNLTGAGTSTIRSPQSLPRSPLNPQP